MKNLSVTPANPDAESTQSPEEATPSRRRFLGAASAASAVAISGLVGAPVLRALVSPGFGKTAAAEWIKVADDVNTLELGTPIKVDFVEVVNDAWVESRLLRSIWIYTDDARTFTAFSGVCPHLGCSFFFEAEKKVFHCPCHHGLFDGKTGAVLGGPPPRGLDALEVKAEDDVLYVKHRLFRPGVPVREVL
jgi:Rieske Fe-S protein